MATWLLDSSWRVSQLAWMKANLKQPGELIFVPPPHFISFCSSVPTDMVLVKPISSKNVRISDDCGDQDTKQNQKYLNKLNHVLYMMSVRDVIRTFWKIPLWTGIVWPSGDYTFILDEGNISAWCCRVRVVNYRRVIYYWIKNGGKNNSWQDAFSSVLIWWRANWDQHTRASEGINIHFSGRLCQWTFPSCLLSGCLHLFNLRIHWLFFYFFSLK